MSALRRFAKSTYAGRLLMIPYRLRNALRVVVPPVWRAVRWSMTSREHYNFTYPLTPLNQDQLAAFVSVITRCAYPTVRAYFSELAEDRELASHMLRQTRSAAERYVADPEVRFGRRLGWYALLRAVKPRIAVETGVDKGLGSCVMAAALLRNAQEGQPGRLIAIDLNPAAGYMIQGRYSTVVDLRVGDSIQVLRGMREPVDFFLHDSDHSAEHEAAEFAAVEKLLSNRALVLSDNSYITGELQAFALRTGRDYLFFQEHPADHWWPGDGIGVGFRPSDRG